MHAIFAMIQVMEDAWADLRMGEFTDLPTNRGWMVAFRRWTSTPTLRRLWPMLRGQYNQDFVKFCETQLGLGVRIAAVEQLSLIKPSSTVRERSSAKSSHANGRGKEPWMN